MKTEIMFPAYVIPMLREACGPEWRRLVDRVAAVDEAHPESLAFSLMMIRLDGCLECETDSFRAMRGCATCALQTVRRYRNNERELLKLYKAALKDVQAYLESHPSASLAAADEPGPAPRPARAGARQSELTLALRPAKLRRKAGHPTVHAR